MLYTADYINNKLVVWSLKAVALASSLLSLFGKEVLRFLCSVAWPLISWVQWPLSHYQLGKEIAQRVQAVLEFTAVSDGGGGRAGGGGAAPPALTGRAYRDAPEPVRKYLQYALREGQPHVKCVVIKQAGYFRFLPGSAAGAGSPAAGGGDGGKSWNKLSGEAYVSVSRPGLVWSATIQLSPFSWVRGFAGYLRGRGSTKWKLCSLFSVQDIEGERSLDTVALLRFLAEAPCYPMALLPSSYLRWEPIDATSARAIITDAGLTASAVFRFNAVGQIIGMRGVPPVDRSRGGGGGSGGGKGAAAAPRDPMCCYYRQYAVMGGPEHPLRIPTEVEAAWELPGGEQYSYAQLEVQDLVCWESMEMPPHHD